MDNLAAAPVANAPVDRTVPAGISVPAKKGGKGAVVLAILFALIAVGLGVWLAILLLNPAKKDNCEVSKSENGSSSATEVTSIKNEAKVREMVKKAANAWATTAEYSMVDNVFDGTAQVPVSDSVQTWSDYSYGFSTGEVNNYVIKRVENNRVKAEESVANVVSGYGLKKISRPTNFTVLFVEPEYLNYYDDGEVFCYSVWDSSEYRFTCADRSWINADKKALVLALAKAYNAKEKDYPIGFIYADPSEITKNKAGSYELLTATESDAAALFYRKAGDNDWKYFTSLQSGPNCSLFNSSELKEAYEGELCFAEDGSESTVKK